MVGIEHVHKDLKVISTTTQPFCTEFIQAEHFMPGSARGVFFVVFLNISLISLMDFGNWQLENNNKTLLKPGTESTNLSLLFMQTIFRPMISLKNTSAIGAAVLYSRWIPTAALMPGKTSSNGINLPSPPPNKFQHLVTSDTLTILLKREVL